MNDIDRVYNNLITEMLKSKPDLIVKYESKIIGVMMFILCIATIGFLLCYNLHLSPRYVENMDYSFFDDTDICTMRYTGQVIKGKPDGEGKLAITWNNGSKSEFYGNFDDGYPNGVLKYTQSDGESWYSDDWSWETGPIEDSTYVGLICDDKLNGYCKRTYADGDVYEGEWKDGKCNGQGKYTWADGRVYEGEWKDGVKSGQGKYTGADGRVYEGEWKDGVKSGQGKYTYADGTVEEGTWVNGEFIG